MAQGTLQQMARQIQAYCPSVPYSLAQRWIIDRFRSVTENYLWSFKLGEGTFSTTQAYNTGSISLTSGSPTVTGSGTTFTAAMVNQQLQVQGFVFNIAAFNATNSLTLDRNWTAPSVNNTAYQVLQAWITPNDRDFHAFVTIIDPALGWRIRSGYTSIELDLVDPRRAATGTPTLIAQRSYNSPLGAMPSAANVPRYELWPFSTTQKQYTYLYERRITDLGAPGDMPPNVMRSDVLVKGALADLSRWPGTREDPNPFYDPYFNQYKTRDAEFREEIEKLLVSDQNIYMTDLTFYTAMPYAPMDSKFMQNHAF